MKTNRTHWTIYVRGVFGRNRTEKRTHVRIFTRDESETGPDDATLDAAIAQALADIRLKAGHWRVERYPVEVETHDGVTFEKARLYSGVTVANGTV